MTWAPIIGTLLKCNIDVESEFQWTKMNEYELSQIIKDKSGQKDENTERQKDNTQDSEGFNSMN